MPNSLRSKAQEAPRLDSAIVAGLMICALLAAGFVFWRVTQHNRIGEKDFAFADIEVDREKLDAQRVEKYGAINLQKAQAEWQALLEAGRALNRGQHEGLSQEKQAELGVQITYHANEILPASGYEGFVVSGEPLIHACQEGLDELLEAVRAGELSLEEARDNPPADKFSDYRDNCGMLLPTWMERGLINDQGEWSFEYAPVLSDVLQRYRWAHIIHDQQKPAAQLTGYEVRILQRWRVEHAQGLSERDRLKYLERLERHDPEYDAAYARGVLAYREGDIERAFEHFEEMAREDRRWQAHATFLGDQLPDPDPKSPAEEAEQSR